MPDQYLPVGLTSSGKSTFVAALGYVVEQGRVEGALTLEQLDGDAEYVHRLRTDWLMFRPIERTSGPAELTRMRLTDSEGRSADLVLPDLPGEVYRAQWEHRGWSDEFDSLARSSSGILIFVHPNSSGAPRLINEIMAGVEPGDEDEEGVIPAWSHKQAPAQTQLVEVLQFLEPVLPQPRPIRVALIISAWDLITGAHNASGRPVPSPSEYVADSEGFAQLHQFLLAHPERFLVQFFGVSAQGGRLDRPDEKQRLQQLNPWERIDVVWNEDGSVVESHDITEPIKWLMKGIDGSV